jgi:hypothetical protein
VTALLVGLAICIAIVIAVYAGLTVFAIMVMDGERAFRRTKKYLPWVLATPTILYGIYLLGSLFTG